MRSSTFPRACQEPYFIKIKPEAGPRDDAIGNIAMRAPLVHFMEAQGVAFCVVVGQTGRPLSDFQYWVENPNVRPKTDNKLDSDSVFIAHWRWANGANPCDGALSPMCIHLKPRMQTPHPVDLLVEGYPPRLGLVLSHHEKYSA